MKTIFCYMMAVLFITGAAPLMAEVYQWTDSNGVVHFSGQPDNQNATPVDLNVPPPVSSSPPAPPTQAPQPATTNAPQPTPAEIAAAQTQQQQTDKICAQYQSNLQLLQETGRRLYTVNDKGEYHYFSDAERQQQINQLNENIQKFCTQSPPAATSAKP